MKRGFYTIMSAQFFSSLADNALFVGAVQLLRSSAAPEWQQAALVPMFALFYVILAPFVGAFADALPKGKVMLTCLGTPNQMREYVKDGTVTEFALWNPEELGALAAYAAAAMVKGEITGKEGETFKAGEPTFSITRRLSSAEW